MRLMNHPTPSISMIPAHSPAPLSGRWTPTARALVARLRGFREHDIHVLGSFIFGLPSDDRDTFDATVALAARANLTFAQFVLLTPFPGTVDFEKWAAHEDNRERQVHGVPITRHWLIPKHQRPKVYSPRPVTSLEDIQRGTQRAWDRF
jgi:radical SAM superfamily enzyme YgiQ (UPF0313 family)